MNKERLEGKSESRGGGEKKAEAIFGAHVTTGSRWAGLAGSKRKGGRETYPNTTSGRQDSFIMSSEYSSLMHSVNAPSSRTSSWHCCSLWECVSIETRKNRTDVEERTRSSCVTSSFECTLEQQFSFQRIFTRFYMNKKMSYFIIYFL